MSDDFQSLDYLAEPAVASRSESVTVNRSSEGSQYTVRRGDTLYTIALKNELDYRQLAAANDIDPPYQIFVGQQLELKEKSTSSQNYNKNTELVTSSNNGNDTGRQAQSSTVRTPSVATSNASVGQISWVWPHDGAVQNNYQSGVPYGKGIAIKGTLDDPIKAIADGVVVYSGNGLRAYGNLILIQHEQNLLSAYAFLARSRVSERQSVKAGEVIADMGEKESAHILHLEIRRDGKPIDPMSLLPKKQ
ncbi:peptidoglycan DD-metalloendopeptidase family protein [Salinibius halmophilus]|uniref:peptidoglycan DD-metalloendopeptidase family protein n=1 Tax=Salinibius halmophilus TaxID=1853216 RepID=UPI001314BE28|nr:peptidoglycan DD-metalloendopeptidase family protein [Salinibius halmophilus]